MKSHQVTAAPEPRVVGERPRRAWPPLVLALACAALTYGCLVWPYRNATEHGLTEGDGAQAWLLTDAGPLATVATCGALISVFLVPWLAMCVAAWAALWAWVDWKTLPRFDRVLLLVAAAAAAAVAAFDFSPVGQDILRWWIG